MSTETNKVLDGVGQDAEIVTNENGGKQSKSPMALHLVDPFFIRTWSGRYKNGITKHINKLEAINKIATFMHCDNYQCIWQAMDMLEPDQNQQLIRIAKVLQYGAERYQPNNWRLIPQEQHINHALIHILAEIMGDRQDSHIDHALCRLMMAMSTNPSPNFSYTDYVLPKGGEVESKLGL